MKEPQISNKAIDMEAADSKLLYIKGMNGKVQWKTSNSDVATINSDGLVIARNLGKTIITGTYKNKLYKCTISVKDKSLHTSATNIDCYEDTTILIKVDNLQSDEILDCYIDDTRIANVIWGVWTEDGEIPLTIVPNKSGKTELIIFSNYTHEELIINLLVIDENLDFALTDSNGNSTLWAVPVKSNGCNFLGFAAVLPPGIYYIKALPRENTSSDIIYNFALHSETSNY